MLEIKEEFKKLIPPLTVEEFKQLEQNCLDEGIREKIITWNGFIIDGHNRYEIATRWNLDYKTESKYFKNENDVKEWMINNQFGRRNLSNYQRSVLALQLEEVFSAKAKERMLSGIPVPKSEQGRTIKKIGDVAKVGKDTIAKVKKIEAVATPEVKAQLSTGELSINQAYQEIKKEEKKVEIEKRREEIKENLVLHELKPTDKKYRIIYADPPWQYGNAMPEYVTEPQDYYSLMSTSDICEMPVKEITEENAVLFIWSTSPHLPEALEVVKSWGFKYKTTFIWDKIKHNMGHYNSVRHEILLVCTKGSCTPDVKKLFDSVVSIERTVHSKKPDEFRNIIDTLYTYGNKIELFARESIKGWDVFGNQIN
jgi:N6-adenosine-specific RNA methylase IME4